MAESDTVETDRSAVQTLRDFAQVSLQNNQTQLPPEDDAELEAALSVVNNDLQAGDE